MGNFSFAGQLPISVLFMATGLGHQLWSQQRGGKAQGPQIWMLSVIKVLFIEYQLLPPVMAQSFLLWFYLY